MFRVMVSIYSIEHLFGDAKESANLVFEDSLLRRPSDRGVAQHVRHDVGAKAGIGAHATERLVDLFDGLAVPLGVEAAQGIAWGDAFAWLQKQLHPITINLRPKQTADLKHVAAPSVIVAADPVDRALELAKLDEWAQDEEDQNMTSETETIEPPPRLYAPASDILEGLKIGDWRKLNQQPTSEEIALILLRH
jgi:hypothetical protein